MAATCVGFLTCTQIQTHKRFKRTLIYYDRQHGPNFQGNPLLQATKQHLNNSETVKNNEKWYWKWSNLAFCCCCVQRFTQMLMFLSAHMGAVQTPEVSLTESWLHKKVDPASILCLAFGSNAVTTAGHTLHEFKKHYKTIDRICSAGATNSLIRMTEHIAVTATPIYTHLVKAVSGWRV